MYDSSEISDKFPSTRVLSGTHVGGRRSGGRLMEEKLELFSQHDLQHLQHSGENTRDEVPHHPVKIVAKSNRKPEKIEKINYLDLNLNLDLPIQIVSQSTRRRPSLETKNVTVDKDKTDEVATSPMVGSKSPLGFNMNSTRKEQRINVYKKMLTKKVPSNQYQHKFLGPLLSLRSEAK